jgi:hypothetical protein
MAAALYMDLGWPWLIAGMVLSGILFALVTHVFLPRLLINPFAAIACVGLLVDAIRHLESGFDAGMANYAYALIVLLPMVWLWDTVFPIATKYKSPRPSHA